MFKEGFYNLNIPPSIGGYNLGGAKSGKEPTLQLKETQKRRFWKEQSSLVITWKTLLSVCHGVLNAEVDRIRHLQLKDDSGMCLPFDVAGFHQHRSNSHRGHNTTFENGSCLFFALLATVWELRADLASGHLQKCWVMSSGVWYKWFVLVRGVLLEQEHVLRCEGQLANHRLLDPPERRSEGVG